MEQKEEFKTSEDKVKEIIQNKFSSRSIIPNRVVKETLKEIYSSNGIERTAKATDLKDWGVEYRDTFARDNRTMKTVRMVRIL